MVDNVVDMFEYCGNGCCKFFICYCIIFNVLIYEEKNGRVVY